MSNNPIDYAKFIPPTHPMWQNNHPGTSRKAAVDAMYRAETDKRRLFDLLVGLGDLGATGDMLALLLEGGYNRRISANQSCTRVGELHAAGFVRRNGEERLTSKGSQAMVWVVRKLGEQCCQPYHFDCIVLPPWWLDIGS